MHPKKLRKMIENKSAKICVVGLGYAGLPTAVAFCSKGFEVIGADIDPVKVDSINAGRSPLKDLILDKQLRELSGRLRATTDVTEATSVADIISIVVPTPVTEAKEPDLTHVESASESISQGLREGQLVVLESTTYPGTTEELVKPILQKSGLRTPDDFGLGYCPERFNPADPEHTMEKIVRIAAGNSKEWAEVVKLLFGTIVKDIVLVRNIKTAEAAKVVENIQRDLNIALFNELSLVFERMGIDVIDVIEAASTKWNFIKMYPGPGVGGHCLPVDPYYLTHKSKELGYEPKIILAGRYVNSFMPAHTVDLVEDGLKEAGKVIKNAGIGVLGLAFKQNIGDLRESPSIEVAKLLQKKGARLRVHDPMVEDEAVHRTLGTPNLSYDEAVMDADCVVITTDHEPIRKVPVERIVELTSDGCVLVDTRNVYNPEDVPHQLIYRGIGRVRF